MAIVPLLALVVVLLGLLGAAGRRQTIETDGRRSSATTASIDASVPDQTPADRPAGASGLPVPPAAPSTHRGSTAPTTAAAPETGTIPRPGAPTVPPGPSTVLPGVPSSTSEPPRRMPATADDCKRGGWEVLVDDQGQPFPNQGACVSFVNAHDAGPSPLVASATSRHRYGTPL